MANNYEDLSINPISGQLDLVNIFYPPNGTTTLVAGTVTVSTTAITANSEIFLTGQNVSGTAGELSITNVVAGVSFDIISTSATDTRTVAWLLFEPVVVVVPTSGFVGANAALTLIGP